MTQKRTKVGKPTGEVVLLGDRAIATKLETALGFVDLPDRATHRFHAYPAGLHPDAARDIGQLFPDGPLLDPFCGGGTTLVEARIAGRKSYGRDLSPVALRVSRARTATPTDEQLTAMRSAARKLVEVARTTQERAPERIEHTLGDWYAPHALRELWSLRQGIDNLDDPITQEALRAVFSSIVVKVSWRKSDTSAQRKRHHRPPGTTATFFHKRTREFARQQLALRELVPEGAPEADIQAGDARNIQVPEPAGLVLSSPPYPATYDYLPMQHLRTVWLGGLNDVDLNQEIGSRRAWRDGGRAARRHWLKATEAWTRSAAKALAPGGVLVVVIGDGLTPMGVVDSSEGTELAARAAGLRTLARASLERPDHARRTSRWEHIMAFERKG